MIKVCFRVFLGVVALCFALSPTSAEAQLCTTPKTVFQWVNFGPGSWGTAPISSLTVCFSPRAVVDATGATHVYSVDKNSHLLEFFQSALGFGWTTIDITAQTGVQVQGQPNPMFFGGTDIQVYAVSSNHLMSFNTTANGHSYQIFDLTSLASASSVINVMPMPILVGTTVHIYLTDTSLHLEDYVKIITGSWRAVDLTTATGEPGAGAPYAYGGNSIQIAVDPPLNTDLATVIELVNPDGSLTNSFSVFDITALAHGTGVSGIPCPLVVGSGSADVAIYTDDSHGHLVEYFKTPSTQWVERNLAVLGFNNLNVSALYFPTSGANGTVRIFSNVVNSAGNGFLFEFDGDPVLGTLSGGPAFAGEGPIFGNPHAVLNNGTVEVFTLN
jgi:hypothetical protein